MLSNFHITHSTYISTCSNSAFICYVEFITSYSSVPATLSIVQAHKAKKKKKKGYVSSEVILIPVSPVQAQASFSGLT